MLGYAEQLQRSTVYLRPSARRAVRFAVEVAYLSHKNQTRRSGEPFVTHPVAVAAILAETRMDRDTVVSGLLHDTVEDTELTFEEVEAMFGTDVRNIVEGETKVSKLPKMARELDSPSRAGRESTDAFQLHGRRSGSRRPTPRDAMSTQVLSVPDDGDADADDWRREAVRRWGALAGAGSPTRDWKLFVESRLSTPPPVSPVDFLQEYYAADTWRLLVSCILMSRVSSWNTKHTSRSRAAQRPSRGRRRNSSEFGRAGVSRISSRNTPPRRPSPRSATTAR